jgi:hypothetical protein
MESSGSAAPPAAPSPKKKRNKPPKKKPVKGDTTSEPKNKKPAKKGDKKKADEEKKKRQKAEEERKKKEAEELQAKKLADAEERKLQEVEERKKKEAEDKARLELEEELEAQAQIEEARKEENERQQLRAANNEEAVAKTRKETSTSKSLKSDLKKTTGVVKKIRMLSESNCAALCKDIQTLKLARYISEIVIAFVEANLKTSDVSAAVKVISMFHQRYTEFTAPLIAALTDYMLPSKDQKMVAAEGNERDPRKQRVLLRMVTELTNVGVITDKKILLDIVQNLCQKPQSTSQNQNAEARQALKKERANKLSLLASLCRHAGQDLLGKKRQCKRKKCILLTVFALLKTHAGITSRKQQALEKRCATDPVVRVQVFSEQMQQQFRKLLMDNFDSVVELLLNEHELLQTRQTRINTERLNRGEVSMR